MYKMKITAAAVGVIILAGSGWFLQAGRRKRSANLSDRHHRAGSVKPTVSATGTLSAVKTIRIGTRGLRPGRGDLRRLQPARKKGQLLATIDPALQNQAVEEAQAQLSARCNDHGTSGR
jgi:multidrug efflux pump subunit AcrA (membrane-fusion protein)